MKNSNKLIAIILIVVSWMQLNGSGATQKVKFNNPLLAMQGHALLDTVRRQQEQEAAEEAAATQLKNEQARKNPPVAPKPGQVGKPPVAAKPIQSKATVNPLEEFYTKAQKASQEEFYDESDVFNNLSNSRKEFFNNAIFYWYWNTEDFDIAAKKKYTKAFYDNLSTEDKLLWISPDNIMLLINNGEQDITGAEQLKKQAVAKIKAEQFAASKLQLAEQFKALQGARVKSEPVVAENLAQENSYQLVNLTVSLSTINSQGGFNESEV